MYPIRKNRPIWSQTFYKIHTCDSICNTELKIDNGILRILYTPGCLFPEKIEPLIIFINNYDIQEIIDEIINIPKKFTLKIHYPMHNVYLKNIFLDKDEIKISDVLELFRTSYQYVYDEEEKNSTERTFTIKKKCINCNPNIQNLEFKLHINDFIEKCDIKQPQGQCNICFDEDGDKWFIKNCKHVYHKECITKWFDIIKVNEETGETKKNNSCPLCRQIIVFCQRCNSNNYIEEEYKGVVVPFDFNNFENYRIETDGPYRIHSSYLEELCFKGIVYDKINNTLSLIPYYTDTDEIFDNIE